MTTKPKTRTTKTTKPTKTTPTLREVIAQADSTIVAGLNAIDSYVQREIGGGLGAMTAEGAGRMADLMLELAKLQRALLKAERA